MIIAIRRYASMGLAACAIAVWPQVVQAQIIPDGTLPTLVGSQNGLDFAIEGGSRSGNNLFHSFSQFSVPTLGSATFNNATDIQNIFSRVTGGAGSNIDGLIQANGNANLFLLNPSGIVFGPNAKLNIGGSFLGATASSIQFADGVEFSAINPAPLLTMSVPIGLQMGQNPGAIDVQGNGHTLVTLLPRSIPVPTKRDPNNTGLSLTSGKALALVGGKIDLAGGILTAEQGRIELGAVRSGTVGLALQTDQSLGLNYANALTYGNLRLDQRSLIDVSGMTGGSIVLQGQNIDMTMGSTILNQQFGSQTAGITQLNAISTIHLQGATSSAVTAINSEALGLGQGSQVELHTGQLRLDASGTISAFSYGAGKIGNIQVHATEKIEVNGFFPLAPANASGIGSSSFGDSQGAQINIKAPTIRLSAGGGITASAFGLKRGGDVNIQASDIWISGLNPVIQFPSTIAATAFSRGQGGNVMINGDRISVRDIGTIASSTLSEGAAGTLTIRASEWIEVNGTSAVIRSSAPIVSPILQRSLRLAAIPTGSSGNLDLNTSQLQILNGGRVSVRSDGPGRSGNLMIATDSIFLKQGGQITASTLSGNGGNLDLRVKNNIIMRNQGTISNNAFGIGDGGRTKISAPVILGLGNSDITANAIAGQGGNIQIMTQGIFGLKFRDRLTSENDITASSEFGVNGDVQVNTIGVDPNSSLMALPADIVDPSQKIATGCTNQTTSSFVATGRGGIPENPTQTMNGDRIWRDLRDVAVAGAIKPGKLAIAPSQLAEATAWQINSQGQPELIDQGLSSMSKGDRVSCAR
jgi:filamentous hemagglutinin family protein